MNDSSNQDKKVIKIAVIGSGLAGLSTAYMLTKGKTQPNIEFQVHLFEKNSQIGMDAASISIGENEDDMRIDVPMRSFMSGYYAHLVRLYEHLDIPAKAARFSFGWYTIQTTRAMADHIKLQPHEMATYTDNRSYLTYSGSRTVGRLDTFVHSSSSSWRSWFNDSLGSLWVMIVVGFSYSWLMLLTLWLHHRGHLRNAQHPVAKMTLEQWLVQNRIHPYFIYQVFVPLFAAVCTNSWQAMLNYPASEVLEYMAMGLFQESYVVTHGIRQVVERLSAPLTDIHLGVQINSIEPTKLGDNGRRRYVLKDDQGRVYECDHLVFATQGNQALGMLQGCYNQTVKDNSQDTTLLTTLEAQISMLKQFSYDTSLVINHTDTRLLPSDRRHWQALNFARIDPTLQLDPSTCQYIIPYPHDTTMTTHILNWTHTRFDKCDTEEDGNLDDDNDSGYNEDGLSSSTIYLQTTNPCISPDPKHILSTSWFERATVTLASKQAIEVDLFPPAKNSKNSKSANDVTLGACQGTNGIWFVGSYCWRGIPLLEGCVASAEKVVLDGISVQEDAHLTLPW